VNESSFERTAETRSPSWSARFRDSTIHDLALSRGEANFPRNLASNFRLYMRDGHNNKQTKQALNNSASIKLKEEKEIKS